MRSAVHHVRLFVAVEYNNTNHRERTFQGSWVERHEKLPLQERISNYIRQSDWFIYSAVSTCLIVTIHYNCCCPVFCHLTTRIINSKELSFVKRNYLISTTILRIKPSRQAGQTSQTRPGKLIFSSTLCGPPLRSCCFDGVETWLEQLEIFPQNKGVYYKYSSKTDHFNLRKTTTLPLCQLNRLPTSLNFHMRSIAWQIEIFAPFLYFLLPFDANTEIPIWRMCAITYQNSQRLLSLSVSPALFLPPWPSNSRKYHIRVEQHCNGGW